MSTIKLSKTEQALIAKLSPALQAQATQEVMVEKTKRNEVVVKNRKEWSAIINENGNIVCRGLGNRFPMGFRPDSLEILLAHAEELKALIVKARLVESK